MSIYGFDSTQRHPIYDAFREEEFPEAQVTLLGTECINVSNTILGRKVF